MTDGKIYNVVYDKNNAIKIVDDSEEDYIYDLNNPKPLDESSQGGKFLIVEDLKEILSKVIK